MVTQNAHDNFVSIMTQRSQFWGTRGDNSIQPCTFCKQSLLHHSGLNSWMNPDGHRFRPNWKKIPPNVRRWVISLRMDHDMDHESSHFISDVVTNRINYSSVDNNSQGFAENSLCLNSEDFDLDSYLMSMKI